MEVSEPSARLIGSALIDLVDNAGYLTGDLGAVAKRFACAPERIETVLEILHGFDPPGVFARDLGECLAIQLRDVGRYDPAMAALIDNLDRLAAGAEVLVHDLDVRRVRDDDERARCVRARCRCSAVRVV